jgi:hypothetical protein
MWNILVAQYVEALSKKHGSPQLVVPEAEVWRELPWNTAASASQLQRGHLALQERGYLSQRSHTGTKEEEAV